MGVLMKAKSCCCGCSLELGTQIIFWISVLSGISALVDSLFGGGAPASLSSQAVTDSAIFNRIVVGISQANTCSAISTGIVAGIGLYAVANKKAQLLLAYVILSSIGLVVLGLVCVLVLVLVFFARDLAKAIVQGLAEQVHNEDGLRRPDADILADSLTFMFILCFVGLCIVFVVEWYCVSVVYSYYCHLKAEEARAPGCVVAFGYVVPSEQGQPGYNFPPSYSQQPPPRYVPAAVYPTTETKN